MILCPKMPGEYALAILPQSYGPGEVVGLALQDGFKFAGEVVSCQPKVVSDADQPWEGILMYETRLDVLWVWNAQGELIRNKYAR